MIDEHIRWGSGLNETIYNKNHMIGVEELEPPFREVTFDNLMLEFCNEYDRSECDDFAVVWDMIDEELHIKQIYNHDTGEIYWEDNFPQLEGCGMAPGGRDWTIGDEVIYCSLLMWGEVEQTIG